ncbi:DUF6119 family protein [Clostridium sporogenes]|uniref:DUF6119 family protein n=1 Tax=Clostridium sporogenes TaxID=1509 RepID=UPI00313BBB84
MPKYNIYKIIKEEENNLIEKLESVNLISTYVTEINGYKFEFFYSHNPQEIDIWWTDLYRDFFVDIEIPKNKIYFGVLLISNSDLVYAVSLGKAHFYLKNFCDLEFGLKLAERIVDKNNMKIKNSKYFNMKKSKTITTYQNGSVVDYDSGESMQYIKAKTIDEEKWGSVVSFGNSVSFSINKNPQDLTILINDIEEILKERPKFSIPRVEEIKDEEQINQLNLKLVSQLLNDDSNIQTEEVSMYGVDFVFSDKNQYTLFLKGKKRETSYETRELNMEDFRTFIVKNNINLYKELDNIYVEAKNENNKGFSSNIKSFLDYIDDEKHCLLDGRWYQFNSSYIDYIETEVNTINFEYIEDYDLSIEEYNSYIKENQLNKDIMYKENYFNTIKEENGFLNFDRNFEIIRDKYKIEKMDLYKDNALYFVKIGTPQKLGYVVDQCISTVNVLKDRETEIIIDSILIEPKEICLWLVLDRKNKIDKLSDLESLIFLMKLVEWKKKVLNAGYEYKVKVNYVTK